MRITAQEIVEPSVSSEERAHLAEGKEDISNVEASPTELMVREKPEPTLRFEPSVVSAALIASYVEKGYFEEGVCRPPQGEDIPNPKDGNV